jgi:hypothetical protein
MVKLTRLTTAATIAVMSVTVPFVLSIFRNAITQAHTHDALRGRIQGSLTIVLIGGPHIANLLHGSVASILDPRMVICAGGLLTTVTVAAISWAVPELRNYTPRQHDLCPPGATWPVNPPAGATPAVARVGCPRAGSHVVVEQLRTGRPP